MTNLEMADHYYAVVEDLERLSPKAIATRACDIAHQLIEEFERREWIIELPEVVPPVTVGAKHGD